MPVTSELNYAKKTIFPKTFRPVGFAYTFYTHTHTFIPQFHTRVEVGTLTAGTGNRRREFLYSMCVRRWGECKR